MGSLELTIGKLVYGGEGLARLDGEVIFTPFVLPGERIEAGRIPGKKGASRARLVGVREASADRAEPPCPVFTQCGGCQYQHIEYSTQLRLKREILSETLRRVGGVEFPVSAIGMEVGEPWGYRNRVQFHFENGHVGYHAMGSHRLVDTDVCPIGSPKINEALRKLRTMIADRRWPQFLRSLELFTDEERLQWNVLESDRPVARHFFEWLEQQMPGGIGALDYQVGGDAFQVSGNSFFQVNRYLLPKLADLVLGDAHGSTAWDLYSGVGLFSLALARRFERVVAIESGRTAIQDLKVNAARGGVELQAIERHTDAFLRDANAAPDFVVADPPREGLGKAAVARLLELSPETLVIVACDPATLARDMKALLAIYDVDRMTLVDLFPQTFHLETIVRLRRK